MFHALHNISALIALLIAITFWHVWEQHRNRFNWHSTGIPISFFLLYVYVLINIIRDAAAWTVFSNSSNLDTEKKWKSERAERRKKRRLFISRQSDYHPPKRRRIRERGAGEFRGMTRCSIEILSFFASSIFVSSADTSLKLIKKNLRNRCPNLYIKTSSNNCTKFFASVRFFREKRNLTLRKMKQKS